MSRARRKYLRDKISKADAVQSKFGKDGNVLVTEAQIFSEFKNIDLLQTVNCPFCLLPGRIQQFLVSTSKGISETKAHCPNCNNGMMLRNLVMKWTAESYAEWVFGYARSGFFQKINFDNWKKRLAELGWANAFWDKYKTLKADAVESGEGMSYADHMNLEGQRFAQEWAKENSSGLGE